MSASQPLSLDKLAAAFEDWQRPAETEIEEALQALRDDYSQRAIELKLLASGYQIKTRAEFGPWVASLQLEKPTRYSRAFLETLAIIAYKQPVTRADIEELRGVAVNSQIIKGLLEREWIRVAGYRDVPGKPAVYVTTKAFLDYFNLTNLSQLPNLAELKPIEQVMNE